jgi:hypothetical protein
MICSIFISVRHVKVICCKFVNTCCTEVIFSGPTSGSKVLTPKSILAFIFLSSFLLFFHPAYAAFLTTQDIKAVLPRRL